jgi:nicotinate-nucleotide adenylyltransferase
VRFIPAANPPHKIAPSVSAEARAEMVKLAIMDNPTFSLDTREVTRTGHSYTVDTLESLRLELGQSVSLVLLMGSDAFTKLHTWHRFTDIMLLCHIGLVQRPLAASKSAPLEKVLDTLLHNHYSENVDDLHNAPAGVITMQAMPPLAIASTDIRAILQSQHSARYLLPDSVLSYISKQHLYT